jgi:hypothetical protein
MNVTGKTQNCNTDLSIVAARLLNNIMLLLHCDIHTANLKINTYQKTA